MSRITSDGTSLLRGGAPSENPFLAFQPIAIPPQSSAPGAPSDDVEPPEMSSRKSRMATPVNRSRSPKDANSRPIGSPKTTTSSSSSSSMSPAGGATSDPFALSNFDWTSASTKPAAAKTSAPKPPQPRRAASARQVEEEDFLGFAGMGTTTTSIAPRRPLSNPFEELSSNPFGSFASTANDIFEPSPSNGIPPVTQRPPNPPQRANSRRSKRRHTAPVGSIDSAVAKLRATSGNATNGGDEKIQEGDESDSDDDDTAVVPPKINIKPRQQSNNKRRNSEPVTTLHNCIDELHRGTALLKYGRRGYPHFRQFQISLDNTKLQWFSKKKASAESSIDLKDINEVRTGQNTPEFDRVGWTSLSPASFSIVYSNRTRRLSLVAKSVDEQKMWVEALRTLRDKAKKGHNMDDVDQVLVHVDYRDRNRPQSRRHSGKFVRGHETNERNVDNLLHKKLISDISTLKERFRTIAAGSNHPKIIASPENDSIRQILSELEERLEELEHEVRHTRDTKIAENDVWRTKVDLEALEEKIQVIIKPKRRWSIKRT